MSCLQTLALDLEGDGHSLGLGEGGLHKDGHLHALGSAHLHKTRQGFAVSDFTWQCNKVRTNKQFSCAVREAARLD